MKNLKKKFLSATLSLSMMLTASISPCYATTSDTNATSDWRNDPVQVQAAYEYCKMNMPKLIDIPFITWCLVGFFGVGLTRHCLCPGNVVKAKVPSDSVDSSQS